MGSAGVDVGLIDRGVLRVEGPDAAHFLQNLVTSDVEGLEIGGVRLAALLTPQGKILFDFFIHHPAPQTYWLDAPADRTGDLAKRLAIYRLRAKVEISDESARLGVIASLADEAPPFGRRRIAPRAEVEADAAGRAAYDAHRVVAAAPQGGLDFAYGDVFPHDVNMDLLGGVDFRKGCYVGQEVVSRMKHRGDIRRRVVRVAGEDGPLETGAEVRDGELPVGVVGTVAGGDALALLRVDRAEEAERAGRTLVAAGRRLRRL